ncbi:nuclease-related domain-containing protein [Bacillus sp. S/N-304-OC-R1]|uniref:nuclease-related domain-containing protein n=1 Tax=Bacillus sp. S/N-304-OC-R1 TaxID=2758034 RepID=UPI001C8D729B|nr:nuclease-related domain-containing protein [Bacillus sp. S/N-304-OC-R1]MBY0123328.1 NERD domain-containing protein [Bacillus sp. S/N-304-OC-R1]
MTMKFRCEPAELKLMRYLSPRMKLSDKDINQYENLEKGFQGELQFDDWQRELSGKCLILNDLMLESQNTVIQIDSLLISYDKIYLFEVKNYEGDFYVDGDRWFTIARKEIQNPLLQLKRTETVLRKILQELGCSSPIESYLIFINPEFQLFQAPLNAPMIFSSQLNRFKNKLNRNSIKNNDRHHRLAERLLALHLKESPYLRLPQYSYEQLQKGMVCSSCSHFFSDFNTMKKEVVCDKCGFIESVRHAFLRSVEEFRFLFPERKITTSAIHEWCKIIKSKKVVWNLLSKNFKAMGQFRSTYYVEK